MLLELQLRNDPLSPAFLNQICSLLKKIGSRKEEEKNSDGRSKNEMRTSCFRSIIITSTKGINIKTNQRRMMIRLTQSLKMSFQS